MLTTLLTKNIWKMTMMAIVAGITTLASAGTASAQYGSSYHYNNARTGQNYAQHGGAGNYSGYGYSRYGRSYSVSNGYYGRSQYQQPHYGTPNYSRGYAQGYGSSYNSRQSYGCRH